MEPTNAPANEKPLRERILDAASEAFAERGYAATSTIAIATRAKVSKRELYALFGDKQAMLVACITRRAQQMRLPPEFPAARDLDALAGTLAAFGAIHLREVCQPRVIAMFRLAIVEAEHSPEVARTLDSAGRQATRAALGQLLSAAQSAGLLGPGDPVDFAVQFLALLWGDLMVGLLLRVAEPPGPDEIERQARLAAATFLQLHVP